MAEPSGKKSAVVWVSLLVATLSITSAVMLLLMPLHFRTDKFWLTFSSVIFAEFLSFGYPMVMTARQKGKNPDTPVQLTMGMVILSYDIGVGILAILAIVTISFSHLLVFHLLLVLILILVSGGLILSGMQVRETAQDLGQQRATLIQLKQDFNRVLDRMNLIEHKAMKQAKEALTELKENMTYSTAESLPMTEQVDQELSACLREIQEELLELERVIGGEGREMKDDELPSDAQEYRRSILQKAKEMKQILARREELIGQLR